MSTFENTHIPVVSFSELVSRLNDLSVADEDILPYLIQVPHPNGGIGPAFQPNPALVTGLDTGLEGGLIIDLFNGRERRKRARNYRRKIDSGWTGFRVVDEGDSWFQYPVKLDDIIDHLMNDHAVFSLSGAGHKLSDMLAQAEVMRVLTAEKPDAFMLSAGGNDLFDDGNIAKLLEPIVVGQPVSSLVGPKFDSFVADIIGKYRGLLLQVHATFPNMVMLIHGYAPAFSWMDRWIGKPLKEAGLHREVEQNRVVKLMLDKFNAAQIALASEPAFDGKLIHIDLRGLGQTKADWFDEIHMNAAQNALAAEKFAEAIAENAVVGAVESEGGLETLPLAEPDLLSLAVAAHAQELMPLDENLLLAELDQRLELIDHDPNAADLPSSPLLVLSAGLETGRLPKPSATALRLLQHWEVELYDLICGDGEADKALRDKLREAIGVDTKTLIGLISGWLATGPLGVSALLAGILAAILVKRLGNAAYEVVCEAWKERLSNVGT